MVINKRDLVSAHGAAEVLEFLARRLRDDLQFGELRVFALSALEALQARIPGLCLCRAGRHMRLPDHVGRDAEPFS
ncbi:MAG: hypothetical protein WAK86_20835 [Pseudonocardiaceae bacterium]